MASSTLKPRALPPVSLLLLMCGAAKNRPAQLSKHPRLGSAPAHTPTCGSKKLASTPPELAGACAAAPALRQRSPAGQLLSLHLGTPGTQEVPISYCGTGRPPEQGLCALHRAPSGGTHHAGPCAAARAGASRLQGGAAKRRRARCAIFPRRCRVRRRPAIQPCAGTYTCHRSRQSVVVRVRRTPQCPPLGYTSASVAYTAGKKRSHCSSTATGWISPSLWSCIRESVLFIGTQFSILYTFMYSPA